MTKTTDKNAKKMKTDYEGVDADEDVANKDKEKEEDKDKNKEDKASFHLRQPIQNAAAAIMSFHRHQN